MAAMVLCPTLDSRQARGHGDEMDARQSRRSWQVGRARGSPGSPQSAWGALGAEGRAALERGMGGGTVRGRAREGR